MVVILWCPKALRHQRRKLTWQNLLNTTVPTVPPGRYGFVTCNMQTFLYGSSFCFQKFSLLTVFFVFQNKASKSDEHIPIVYPEAILCVEIYERRHGSVKVISWNFRYMLLSLCWNMRRLSFVVISLPRAESGISCVGEPAPHRSEGQYLLFD